MNITFATPWLMVLAVLPLGLLVWYLFGRKSEPIVEWESEDIHNVMIATASERWRHLGVVSLVIGMLGAVVLVAGFQTGASTVSSEAKEERASLCFIVFDNSGSGNYANEPGGESRFERSLRELKAAIEGQSSCQQFGLIAFSGDSEALVAPTPGNPAGAQATLAQLDALTTNSGGTDIAAGLQQALTQCKLGEFGPCNFLLVSDLADRSEGGSSRLLEQLSAVKLLGSLLYVYDVGAARGYDGQVAWPTPQTDVFDDPTVAEASKQVSSPAEAFAEAKVQTFSVPAQEVQVPASTPLWPRLLGGILLLLLIVPFTRTIRE
ncbi:VWA domain-containing protein [Candidatus Saccharibacteria bacterium]|nr:VWA domain-containing protein [Candidatus Saccharibacteria bacterium]MCB9820918.1 VWA domain-containing protein [Candidatus Nomurabacteria bacterium]